MAVFEIPENLEYIEDIRRFETNDPGHADVFNSVMQDLVNNDAFLKRKAEQHDEKLAWFWNCGNRKVDTEKSVDAEGFQLFQGVRIVVRFQFGNAAENMTLNVNGTGAAPVRYRGTAIPADYIRAGHMIEFAYYDNCWNVVGDLTQAQVDDLKTRLDSLADNCADKNIYGDTFVSMGRKDGTTVGNKSFAFGGNIEASGNYSHAEGQHTTASGNYSHAEGYSTTASEYASHAEGQHTTASGNSSHAEGSYTKASVDYSHAEGGYTTASGNYSHAEGGYTKASVDYSHAEGYSTTASEYASHAEGYSTTASNYASHTSGKYNKAMTTGGANNNQIGDVFVIGNGTSYSAKSNALRVTYSGDVMGTKAFQSSGADYAEFIKPWADGNPDNEDRAGYFVTVKDGLLYKANKGDYIYGITSGNPSIVGNADEDYYWRYERDEFNRIVMEDVPEMVQLKDDDGNPVFDEETHEPVMVETGNIIPNARMKLAEGYDPSLQGSYIERKDRKEWDYVGMLGVLPVRDDGTCLSDHYCKCGQGGIATFAAERGFDTYMVIERISDNIVSVILK